MAVTTTLAPQVEDALLALYQARPALAGAQVGLGPALPEGKNFVLVGVGRDGGSINSTEVWSALGNLRRRETVNIPVMIHAQEDGGGDEVITASRDAAFALMADVMAALREDPTLGSLVTHIEPTAYELDRGMGGGRWSDIYLTLTYTATLPLT